MILVLVVVATPMMFQWFGPRQAIPILQLESVKLRMLLLEPKSTLFWMLISLLPVETHKLSKQDQRLQSVVLQVETTCAGPQVPQLELSLVPQKVLLMILVLVVVATPMMFQCFGPRQARPILQLESVKQLRMLLLEPKSTLF